MVGSCVFTLIHICHPALCMHTACFDGGTAGCSRAPPAWRKLVPELSIASHATATPTATITSPPSRPPPAATSAPPAAQSPATMRHAPRGEWATCPKMPYLHLQEAVMYMCASASRPHCSAQAQHKSAPTCLQHMYSRSSLCHCSCLTLLLIQFCSLSAGRAGSRARTSCPSHAPRGL